MSDIETTVQLEPMLYLCATPIAEGRERRILRGYAQNAGADDASWDKKAAYRLP